QDLGIVRLRAFGSYALKITEPGKFIKDIVGTAGLFETAEISDYLRDMLIQGFSNAVASKKIPALDLAANYKEISETLTNSINTDFATHGLTLVRFMISNISVPPEVEAALDKRSEMGAIGDLNRFTQYQVANAIPEAAKNPGGLAGAGMGLGAGLTMGNQMANAMNQSIAAANQAAPAAPTAPTATTV